MAWCNPIPEFRLVPTSDPESYRNMPWWPQMTTGIPVPFDTPYGPEPKPDSPYGRTRTFSSCWSPFAKAGHYRTLADKNEHPGMFGAVRKHDVHCGVDLYVPHGTWVYPVEAGEVVRVGWFTGPDSSPPTPWWNPTSYIMIEGVSGVVCYGELNPGVRLAKPDDSEFTLGLQARTERWFGGVAEVLKEDKERPRSMLHLELYEKGFRGEPVDWALGAPRPAGLLDPTPFLLELCR